MSNASRRRHRHCVRLQVAVRTLHEERSLIDSFPQRRRDGKVGPGPTDEQGSPEELYRRFGLHRTR